MLLDTDVVGVVWILQSIEVVPGSFHVRTAIEYALGRSVPS